MMLNILLGEDKSRKLVFEKDGVPLPRLRDYSVTMELRNDNYENIYTFSQWYISDEEHGVGEFSLYRSQVEEAVRAIPGLYKYIRRITDNNTNTTEVFQHGHINIGYYSGF